MILVHMASFYNILANLANALYALCQHFYNAFFKESPSEIDMAEQIDLQASPQSTESNLHGPSVKDVLDVKQILFERFHLPIELVEVVIDFAEYWPLTTSVATNDADRPIHVRSGAEFENRFLVSNSILFHLSMD